MVMQYVWHMCCGMLVTALMVVSSDVSRLDVHCSFSPCCMLRGVDAQLLCVLRQLLRLHI
jgi:hypothetical protein